MINEVEGKKKAFLLNHNLEIIRRTTHGSLISALRRSRDIDTIVMDGTVIQPIIRVALELQKNQGLNILLQRTLLVLKMELT